MNGCSCTIEHCFGLSGLRGESTDGKCQTCQDAGKCRAISVFDRKARRKDTMRINAENIVNEISQTFFR